MGETMDYAERAVDEALAGDPRADELAEMIAALEVRRATLMRERDAAATEAARKEWMARIREAEKQIALLRQEQAITQFVERSVRAAATRPRVDEEEWE